MQPVIHRLALVALLSAQLADQRTNDGNRWESAIRAFESQDSEAPPPRNAILFVGSSSIRLWDVQRAFPEDQVIRRGFGGSQIADCVGFASRIIIPYQPRIVVVYAGDNDIAAEKSPTTVLADFKALVKVVRDGLPRTRLLFIAIKPSIRRWEMVDKMRRANALIREVTDRDDLLEYVDIDGPMLGEDGKPRPELFVEDGLHLSAAGYRLWESLLSPHLKPRGQKRRGQLRIATCQFPVSGEIPANARWIRQQMREAHTRNADVVHFSEAALSGYPGTDYEPSQQAYDWRRHRQEMESILALARELRLWVVLGSDHRLSGKNKPHNSLYVIDPRGEIVDRYDKRFCTGGDLKHYSPGDHFVTFDVNGVRCGLLICYDVRFPELYRRYHQLGVQVMFHSFHNARQKEGSIHPMIMPASVQVRAATNYMFVSANNSSAPRSWESLFVTPDGRIQKRLALDKPGVMVNTADTTRRFYDASRPYRLQCIEGKWNSGDAVNDPRSKNRRIY